MRLCMLLTHSVIPAEAGIYHPPVKFSPQVMAPRLRGGDAIIRGYSI